MKALLSLPVDTKAKLGGIVVVHENRGLNPYIEDVARRAALAGFISIAPDALTPLGGYPGNDDAGRELQAKRDKNEMLEDFIAAYEYLKSHPDCNGRVGVVWLLLWRMDCKHDGRKNTEIYQHRYLFNGSQPPTEDVPKIKSSSFIALCRHWILR
jgi:carboxymethylenebutenolidase